MYETHSFNIYVATMVGSDAAAVLHNIAYWVRKNEANNANVHEGKAWTYNSIKALTELFPYITQRGMRGVMDKLKANGLIEVGHFNRLSFDRTTWYTITPKARALLGFDSPKTPLTERDDAFAENDKWKNQKGQMHLSKTANGSDEKGRTIPDINTDIKQQIKEESVANATAADAAPWLEDEKEGASALTLTPSNSDHNGSKVVPYQEIVSLYNETCKSLPKARGLNDKRKASIRARWKENGESIETFRELFQKAEASYWLTGDNPRKWKASFDWLLTPSKFLRVLEGAYPAKANTKTNTKGENQNDRDDREQQDEKYAEQNRRTAQLMRERLERARAIQAERERAEADRGIYEHHPK